MKRNQKSQQGDPKSAMRMAAIETGWSWAGGGVFGFIAGECTLNTNENNLCSKEAYAVITIDGIIHANRYKELDAEEWQWIFAHCFCHLAFEHFQMRKNMIAWKVASDVEAARFLADLKFGTQPFGVRREDLPGGNIEILYENLCYQLPPQAINWGTSGRQASLIFEKQKIYRPTDIEPNWKNLFGEGVERAAENAIRQLGEGSLMERIKGNKIVNPSTARAWDWFLNHYPLLGATAAHFTLIENTEITTRMQIAIAAVDVESREIYINPMAELNESEVQFVLAHEVLHVALRHSQRREGRDHFMWNCACDYVINGWLNEMKVGMMPKTAGLLYDIELKDMSAEQIYDRLVKDLRLARKLISFRGSGVGDIIEKEESQWWNWGEGVKYDELFRKLLSEGLFKHQDGGRGFMPAGLLEEIRAITAKIPNWDVALAQWFDERFPVPEARRTYARPGRRASAMIDIPVPSWVADPQEDGKTFGVVLDTSGSMDRHLLALALGSIAAYARNRQVLYTRLVFCDAEAYDEGYVSPDSIAEKYEVKGRGGTILQPGVDLLQKAKDFPDDGPILIITDGYCESDLRVRRDHAYLVPLGHKLPFEPKGPVFWLRDNKNS